MGTMDAIERSGLTKRYGPVLGVEELTHQVTHPAQGHALWPQLGVLVGAGVVGLILGHALG
ncbi:hypothetical protein [Streptomyces sp. NPDC059949]|uniref:hypothetical protein n=1 Tax=Streptomyces sp. NPDC059949 TaxID=3347013 RepID=UPI0036586DC5